MSYRGLRVAQCVVLLVPVLSAQVLRQAEVEQAAVAASPALAAARETIASLEARRPQAVALTEPTLAVGWMGKAAPFLLMDHDPSSARTLTISQTIPLPERRRLNGQLAADDVRTAKAQAAVIERDLRQQAATDFAEYFYADRALVLSLRTRDLLDQIARTADAQYRVGKAPQQDLFRMQLESSLALARTAQLESARRVAADRLRSLLNLDAAVPLAAPEALEPLALDANLAADPATLQTAVREHAADLATAAAMIDRAHTAVALAGQGRRPDLTVGYSLAQRASQSTMNGLQFSLNLPIFPRQRQQPALQEAVHAEQAARHEHMQRQRDDELDTAIQLNAFQTAERLLTVYSDAILPQAELTLASSLNDYQNARTTMQQVLANLNTLVGYQADRLRQIADQRIALARLEQLIGTVPATHPLLSAVTPSSTSEAR